MKSPMLIAVAAAILTTGAAAQTPLFQDQAHPYHANSADKAQQVEYLYPEQVTIPAGKTSPVELHFRVEQGLHINSHTPSDKFLIPTAISFPAGSGVKLEGATYPAGVEYTLPADPETRLNVYTGEFAIRTRLSAQRGDHLVQARLRYQACDQTQCMPPRTATVAIDVVGK